MKTYRFLPVCFFSIIASAAFTQSTDPALTEVWEPKVPVVTPGKTSSAPPSDAIVLFDGTSFKEWTTDKGEAPRWTLSDGAMTVLPRSGGIMTKQTFGDMQLHIEWRTPEVVKGEGQGRGNSGIILMGQYEVQVLDNYNNQTYVNGQAASLYKQVPPMVNACRPPGEWQTYDIIFKAPHFYEDGRIRQPATVTVIHNGVLVQYNSTLFGSVRYIGIARYQKHEEKLPLSLQDHGDLVSFRNIWVRPL